MHEDTGKSEMRSWDSVFPVLCQKCPKLALLVVDGKPLCGKCLLKLPAHRDPKWIKRHSKPLRIHNTRLVRAGQSAFKWVGKAG